MLSKTCYAVQNLVRKVSTQVIAKSQWIQIEEQCWFLIGFRGFFSLREVAPF